MWCPRCRQDVPAIAAPFEQTLCCARCRQPLTRLPDGAAGDDPQTARPATRPGEKKPDDPLEEIERLTAQQQAELDHLLSRAEWLLGIDATPAGTWNRTRPTGFHRPHETLRGHHAGARRHASRPHRASRITMASWCALAVALTGFVCGGILLAWSLVGNRPELWNVGETVTLASQVGLLIGLILQLERLGHDRHQTVNRLTLLDERVESLRTSAAAWSTNRSLRADQPGAPAADGYLADLKNQLASLADRLGEKRSA